jgi:hypothetical protein
MKLVTIHTAFTSADADLVYSRLAAADFHPVIVDGIAATVSEGYILSAGGIRVQVPDDEATEATEFLTGSAEMPPE